MATHWLPVLLLCICATRTSGQGLSDSIAPPRLPASVTGRVVTQLPGGERAIVGAVVTVHRVGTDSAGPLDSARTDPSGRYVIPFTRFGDEAAIYFAAVVYSGIAYFSAPLRGARVSGEDGVITVFDTTSGPIKLNVQGHHLAIGAPGTDGTREVTEVWEISNDTTVTLVGKDSLSEVWSALFPSGATRLKGGEGDVTATSIVERDGRVVLLSAFGPGVKQLSYSYFLPASSFPLTLRIEKLTSVLEVLLEEQTARATGAELRTMEPAVTQGRTFQRFLSQDVPVGAQVRIAVPAFSAVRRTQALTAVAALVGLVLLAGLWRAFSRQSVVSSPLVTAQPEAAETLLAAIAALDARHERGDPTLDAERYGEERAALKARAAAALADAARVP